MKIKIINGTLICPTESAPRKGNILIDSRKFVSENQHVDFQADTIIDAGNQWIMPSLVDLKSRIHPPGIEIQYDNGIKELKAYEQNGFSHLTCFPNAFHCFDKPEIIHKLKQTTALNKLHPIGALTIDNQGKQLSDYQALHLAGCLAFSSGLKPVEDLSILRAAYELLADLNYLVIICPQDYTLSKNGCAHEGKIATRLGLKPIPRMAETLALTQHFTLIEATGLRAHFSGLTSHKSIEIIEHYKSKGLNITCDVAIAHLHLTDIDIEEFNPLCHVNPPLRESKDLLSLKKGLLNGTIDAITSDHTPFGHTHKLAPFEETLPGMSTLDSMLKLCLKSFEDLSSDEKLFMNLNQWIAKFTRHPLDILGLQGGTLQPNDTANLIIINPNDEHTLDTRCYHAGFKHSPFDNWSFSHNISHLILNGEIVSK